MILSGEIKRIEDWYYKAGPKDKDVQWKNDYSAKEFAKLWFDENENIILPHEIAELIGKVFGNFEVLFGIPEHATRIDKYPGEQRNHDMFLFCKKENGEDFIVCIEAKVAEPLGDIIKKELDNVKNKSKTNKPNRINDMKKKLKMEKKDISNLRYQLFTGSVGTIKEGENYKVKECFFLILQILPELKIPGRNEERKINSNYNDIINFLKVNEAMKIVEAEEAK